MLYCDTGAARDHCVSGPRSAFNKRRVCLSISLQSGVPTLGTSLVRTELAHVIDPEDCSKELRATIEQLRSILDHAFEFIGVVDVSGRVFRHHPQ